MRITEVQGYSISHLVNNPFSAAWSDDNNMALITDKGVHILALFTKGRTLSLVFAALQLFILSLLVSSTNATDITSAVFGTNTDILPAAFGDFDADENTDLFVLKDKSTTLEILLGSDVEPFLRESELKCKFKEHITSVVPGDFDGDALMDVFITFLKKSKDDQDGSILGGAVLWGGLDKINCSYDWEITMKGQPLAIDYDRNMIIDLFGVNIDDKRTFWIFNHNRTMPRSIPIQDNNPKIPVPNSHAYLDLNGDYLADLFVTTEENYEVWFGTESVNGFVHAKNISFPPGIKGYTSNGIHIGQTVFQDFELEGKLDLLVPVCFDSSCANSTVFVYSDETWHNLKINFHDGNDLWTIPDPTQTGGVPYINTITFRAGDFNMDGYPDLLATLHLGSQYKTFFLENVECAANCDGFSRTFVVRWSALSPYNNDSVLGVFYDFLQDGILDVILVHKSSPTPTVSAFRNSLDYDANFVKVMVVTGLTNKKIPLTVGPLGKKRRTYGTNLPGPKVSYRTTTQEGNPRAAVSTQLPQSAHFSLNLPYIIFGLGRTPNFVDSLTIGVYGHHQNFPQTIPNSQIVVIPWPTNEPRKWRVQLFVTPSKLILQSVFALLGTCIFISIIIGVLYWKERREDHFEKLQEAHRFHFDAM